MYFVYSWVLGWAHDPWSAWSAACDCYYILLDIITYDTVILYSPLLGIITFSILLWIHQCNIIITHYYISYCYVLLRNHYYVLLHHYFIIITPLLHRYYIVINHYYIIITFTVITSLLRIITLLLHQSLLRIITIIFLRIMTLLLRHYYVIITKRN